MQARIILNKLAKQFPKKLAQGFDHVGNQCGKMPGEVQKVMLCLDFDASLMPIVRKERPDMIISHHPFIFGTMSKVLKFYPIKREMIEELAKLNIPVYSYHTNFDTGRGGMNDALTGALGLKNVYAPLKDPMMRIGELDNEMDVEEFAKFAKQSFNVQYGLLINAGKKTVKKVGVIGGGGSRGWALAKEEGCDIYVSGDAPHYVRRDIVNSEFNYLDFPHEIEKIFMPTMKTILQNMDSSLEVIIIDHEELPKVI